MNRRFKRKQKPRQLKQTYLIVCEGFSEEIYFKDMKRLESLKNISVKVVNPSVTTPNEIFNYAWKEYRQREYDAAFCVVDGDVLIGSIATKKRSGSERIAVIVSRPCFELWYLLHYKLTNSNRKRQTVGS